MLKFSDFFEDTTDYSKVVPVSSRLTVVIPYVTNSDLMKQDPEGYFNRPGVLLRPRAVEEG